MAEGEEPPLPRRLPAPGAQVEVLGTGARCQESGKHLEACKVAELLVEGVPEDLWEGGEVDAAEPGVHHQVHEPHQHVGVVHLGG